MGESGRARVGAGHGAVREPPAPWPIIPPPSALGDLLRGCCTDHAAVFLAHRATMDDDPSGSNAAKDNISRLCPGADPGLRGLGMVL